jgi:MFS family permease
VTGKTSSALVDARGAASLVIRRQGLVLEAAGVTTGDGSGPTLTSFDQAEGPLERYRRTVSVTPTADGGYVAVQVVELKVGLPWWSWLLVLPLRASLGRLAVRGDPGPTGAGAGRAPGSMPWWAPPQRLDRRSATVIAILAALAVVQGFVAGVLPETLTYAASEMHAGTFAQGVVFAAVELSTLPALAALVLADRRGRRAVVLWATAGSVLFTALGALSPTVPWLAAGQVAAGALVVAAGIAGVVVAVEEVPAGCRAWSVGVLGMAGGLGGGIPLALLPLAGLGAGGWRWLFALSAVCLPVVAACARQLPESRRWTALGTGAPGPAPARPSAPVPAPTSAPVAARLRGPARGRLLLVGAGALLLALFASPASQFETQFLRQQRHYGPLAISVLEQVAGTIGGLGVLVGGRLADTHGRRPVAVACVAGATIATLASYLGHSWLMWGAAVASQFFFYATAPALGVYGAELFATSSRARSAGLVAAASALGGVAGLLATGALGGAIGTLAPALAVLAVGPVLLVVLLVVAYPETAGVSLEELAPERTPT